MYRLIQSHYELKNQVHTVSKTQTNIIEFKLLRRLRLRYLKISFKDT